jgi:ABC-2 type transport system permease protein
VLLRLRVDETGGTLEPVLASGVTRSRWLGGHVVNAVAGCVALVVLFALSMGLAAGQVLGGTATQVRELVVAGLAQLPGILVVGAAALVVICLVPRWAVPASWAVLLGALVVGPMFGPGLDLPSWVQDLSPFTHSPKAPAAAVTAAPVLALAALCLGLGAVALLALRRRDLALPA